MEVLKSLVDPIPQVIAGIAERGIELKPIIGPVQTLTIKSLPTVQTSAKIYPDLAPSRISVPTNIVSPIVGVIATHPKRAFPINGIIETTISGIIIRTYSIVVVLGINRCHLRVECTHTKQIRPLTAKPGIHEGDSIRLVKFAICLHIDRKSLPLSLRHKVLVHRRLEDVAHGKIREAQSCAKSSV